MDHRVAITHHAHQRIKQRCKVTEFSVKWLNKWAYNNGLKMKNIKNQEFIKWFKSYIHNNDYTELRIFNQIIYVYRDKVLITVLKIPNQFKDIDLTQPVPVNEK